MNQITGKSKHTEQRGQSENPCHKTQTCEQWRVIWYLENREGVGPQQGTATKFKSKTTKTKGSPVIVYMACVHLVCIFTKMHEVVDKKTNEQTSNESYPNDNGKECIPSGEFQFHPKWVETLSSRFFLESVKRDLDSHWIRSAKYMI